MKNKLIYGTFLLTVFTNVKYAIAQYEDSSKICDKCNCESNDADFTVDCVGRGLQRMFNDWPNHNKPIIATFSKNNIITLQKIPASDDVLELIFSHCGIENLEDGLFQGVKNVEFVDLSHNLITAEQLGPSKFKGVYSKDTYEPIAIKHLDLAYNQIHTLPPKLFEHMDQLEVLNLEGNDFAVLDPSTQSALTSLHNLVRLNLANNELTELVQSVLEVSQIVELNLAKNSLDYVPVSLRYIRQSLEKLILDDNPIMALEQDSFKDLENLIELSLNNLDVKLVNVSTFTNLKKLKKLSLANNQKLIEIDPQAFDPSLQIQELYLNNNSLREINAVMLDWSKLKVFEIKDNPLECSCDMFNITTQLWYQIRRNEDGPLCVDLRIDQSKQMYSLKSDICDEWEEPIYTQQNTAILRNAMISLSVILFIIMLALAALAFTKYRKYLRSRNYAFASNVQYNPLNNMHQARL